MSAAVVTGIGVSCALGSGKAAFWDAMLAGLPAAFDWQPAAEDKRTVRTARMTFTGAAAKPDGVPAFVRAGHAALAEAIGQAALDEAVLEDAGLVLGTTSGGTMDEFVDAGLTGDLAGQRDFGASAGIGSSTDWLAARFGIAGPIATLSAACTSSAAAIAHGMLLIRRGVCDVVLAGGCDRLRAADAAGFGVLRAITKSACRPFDRQRDGMLPADGAAFLVLESASHAHRRGVSPIAELVAAGFSADAHHATAPHPEGIARAMRTALQQAEIDAGRIGYVNCHGTGTAQNDRAEALAMRAVFGDELAGVYATSSKSVTGHLLGTAGALEALICALVLQTQVIPPMRTVVELDPCVGFSVPWTFCSVPRPR
jgi:3-oxoacyl-(acyl-carrier-protein) synthase